MGMNNPAQPTNTITSHRSIGVLGYTSSADRLPVVYQLLDLLDNRGVGP
jgi:hypothetical protein